MADLQTLITCAQVNSVTRNTNPANSWRMIYNNNEIIDLSESEGITGTVYHLFVVDTKAECIAAATAAGFTNVADWQD